MIGCYIWLHPAVMDLGSTLALQTRHFVNSHMSSLINERSVQREPDMFEAKLNISLGEEVSCIMRNVSTLYIVLFDIIEYIMM